MSEKKSHRPSADIVAEIKAKEDERKAIGKRLTALRRELRAAEAAEAAEALAVYAHLAETGRLDGLLAEIEQPDGDEQPDGEGDEQPDHVHESPGF